MKIRMNRIVALVVLICGCLSTLAQDITITVSPVQRVLPPQLMLLVGDPGSYFNIAIINNSQTTQNIYLCMQLEHIYPSSGVSVTTPIKRLPRTPLTISAGQARQLTLVEMRTLFSHIPKNEVQVSGGVFENNLDGTFGLLPEGLYQMHLVAYKWDPLLGNPQVVSNPQTGVCDFTICYKAQAPEFITPMSMNTELLDLTVAKMNRMNPQFTWRQPVVACNPSAQQFTYEIRVCELAPNQQPDDALRNAPIYIQRNLLAPMAIIPRSSLDRMQSDKVYVAQVTASPRNTTSKMMGFSMIENQGKSPYRMFRIVDSDFETESEEKMQEEPLEKKRRVFVEEYTDIAESTAFPIGLADSPYVYRYPRLQSPAFFDYAARKLFVGEDIKIAWRKAWYLGGKSQQKKDLAFRYAIQLFKGEPGNPEGALQSTPIYEQRTLGLSDTIRWSKIQDRVSMGDYLVLRVMPECTNERSIGWDKVPCNVVDFAVVDRLSRHFVQCTSSMSVNSKQPTTKKASDLKGRMVSIGEFTMTIDEITKVEGSDAFKGRGRIEWRPMGIKVMVAVKFDNLQINQQNQVYGGYAESYQSTVERKRGDIEAAEQLFSEWGIDNLIGDINLPYAEKIQKLTDDGRVKTLAQKLDISDYYAYVKRGQLSWSQFLKGEIEELHLPLPLPKSLNHTPVDLQIVSMRFAPDKATMNVLGELALPNSDYHKNEMLLFGASQLCLIPYRVLPENGCITLLDNSTVKDLQSSFEMRFKVPTDLLNPKDGCYISWHSDALEQLNVDFDLSLAGKAQAMGKLPTFNFRTTINDWDDWHAVSKIEGDNEGKTLQNWNLQRGDIVIYDHSKYYNALSRVQQTAGHNMSRGSDERQGIYVAHAGSASSDNILFVDEQSKNYSSHVTSVSLKLTGIFAKKERETRLAWELENAPAQGDWYYCVYRKGAEDTDFQFVLSTNSDTPVYSDFLLTKGQLAQYYVTLQFADGRSSRPSNIVTVTGE